MPAWKMHIAIANEVNKKLKLDEELFLYGNVMPDNEGYVVKNPSVIVEYAISHFGERGQEGLKERLPNYKKFYSKYKDHMDNPLVVGYLVHLMTDFYWNRFTFKNYYIHDDSGSTIGIRLNTGKKCMCDKESIRKLKQTDFKVFSEYLVNNDRLHIPKFNIEKIEEKVKDIEEIPLNREDIEKTVDYLNNMLEKYEFIEEYKVFDREIFEREFENCIQFILNEFDKNLL